MPLQGSFRSKCIQLARPPHADTVVAPRRRRLQASSTQRYGAARREDGAVRPRASAAASEDVAPFEKFHLVFASFRVAFEALPVLLYILCVLGLLFSSLIYFFEARNQNLESLTEAAWLTIVTMTTVGYGDKVPVTSGGQVTTGVLIVTSALYMAVPVGIIGNAFNDVWADRGRLLLMKKCRDRLTQWGYRSADIPKLFQIFGKRHQGELSFNEFRRMFKEMKIGMQELEIFQLFQSFDDDGSGRIDDEEFMHALFPKDYVAIYARRNSMEAPDGDQYESSRRKSVWSVFTEPSSSQRSAGYGGSVSPPSSPKYGDSGRKSVRSVVTIEPSSPKTPRRRQSPQQSSLSSALKGSEPATIAKTKVEARCPAAKWGQILP